MRGRTEWPAEQIDGGLGIVLIRISGLLRSEASADSALLVCPETVAESLLQYLAGTALGQIGF